MSQRFTENSQRSTEKNSVNLCVCSSFLCVIKHSLSLLFVFILINSHAQNFDTRLLESINSEHSKYDGLWLGITNSATTITALTPVSLYAMGHFHYVPKAKRNAYVMAGAFAVNTVITYSLKWSVNRERPFVSNPDIYKKAKAGSYSFPSGHTSMVFATATSLTIAYPKWYVALPAYAWAGAVGYSRMHLGVHYPSDVLAGVVTGALSSFVAYKINKKFFK